MLCLICTLQYVCTYVYICIHAYILILTLNIFITDAPSIISGTVLTPHSIEVTWNAFPTTSGVIGYLISYNTTASYTTGGNMIAFGASTSSYILTNLEEYTSYTITVRAFSNSGMSDESNKVWVTTYTASK